jgi:hypothetical protein
MYKMLFLILLATTLFTACHKKAEHSCPTDDYAYIFKDNARVDTTSRWSRGAILKANVEAGNKRVFIYQHTYTPCAGIADADYIATVIFEADPNATHFKYNTDSLDKIRCYYGSVCYGCRDAVVPAGGTIEGTRVNDKLWKLDLDLTISTGNTVKASANFIPGN